jgi:hypothetical protein
MDMNKTKEIKDLPKPYQEIYQIFVKMVDEGKTESARQFFRPLISFYTSNDYEIPEELELQYARLYIRELDKEAIN